MTIKQFNNIDKPLTSGGRETPPLNMQQFIKLADTEKYEFDALNEKLELLKDAWLKQREPGETYDSWFKRTPKEEIIRITLKEGGRIIKFSDYKKPKIKTINLSDYFDMGRRLIDLTQSERDTLRWILNKSLNPKK
tara:strand:+ start:260 stop:667 length:408 start_codon:yes stop_codon:yes gene_type:complete